MVKIMKVEIRKTELAHAVAIRDIIDHEAVLREISGYPHPVPLEQIQKEINNGLRNWKTGESYGFTVFVDGKIAGTVVLEEPNKTKTIYEVGGFIGHKYWNSGIATEALKQIIDFGFKKGIHQIQADHDKTNPGSGKVMEKAGMKHYKTKKDVKRPFGLVNVHFYKVRPK
jgi:RimJ/RimL family protein N-acetyltransferase